MKIKMVKPIGRKNKYQLIYNRISDITEEKAIVVICENGDSQKGLWIAVYKYLRKLGIKDKYTILLRDDNKVYIQLKKLRKIVKNVS